MFAPRTFANLVPHCLQGSSGEPQPAICWRTSQLASFQKILQAMLCLPVLAQALNKAGSEKSRQSRHPHRKPCRAFTIFLDPSLDETLKSKFGRVRCIPESSMKFQSLLAALRLEEILPARTLTLKHILRSPPTRRPRFASCEHSSDSSPLLLSTTPRVLGFSNRWGFRWLLLGMHMETAPKDLTHPS